MLVFRPFASFLVPLGSILACSLIAQVEYQNNNWKQVHTTPQTYATIFLAKYSVLFILVVGVLVIVNTGTILLGIIPCLVLEKSFPDTAFPADFFFKQNMTTVVSALPILALQFLLSIRFRDFMMSIGIGFLVYIGTMMALNLKQSYLSPYSYVLFYFDDQTGHADANYLAPVIYFVGLSLISYFLYVTKKLKG